MGLKAHLAVGRNPFYAAIGGDALLKAALHQLGVITLPLHLRTRDGAAKAMALWRNTRLARKVKCNTTLVCCGVGRVRAVSAATPCDARL